MSVTVKAPHDLRALLATMKSAKTQGIHMAIWDRDIKAIEDAIATIEAIRAAIDATSHG
jgi:pyrimidine operon attenuation protein/uracil phosphoribosyltransferase